MAETTDLLQIRIDPPAATIVLNRPHRHNALDRKQIRNLIDALEDLHGERRVRAIILTGNGSSFCAGTDLHELNDSLDASDSFLVWHEDTQAFLELIETMLRFPKPVIVAVNGPVVGSGLALMLAADFVVASVTARITLPEARRGLSPGLTTPLLNFRIGTTAAARLVWTGSEMSAEQAHHIGLFHELAKPDLVWARSFEIANQCAAGAKETHQLTKQMINETIGETLMTQLAIGAANMAAARTTDAAREGVQAFLEKRAPQWD